ncbi:alpha-amylase family glycosyl hydrolase [Flagellimonas allohymeniacidonis]|uniref:Alpha amylase n=1 Tax=Flagellimonas allohymeniacidonis TaxID=2517819 RepID=A0A4Q8QHT5_9FLAO|nr:alpha-amylase family glycosyl hydrolase [Allomuricauda hymeniacidonis]TAI47736.1 alpha amylase [Allomuricauda hymeniacidonis]
MNQAAIHQLLTSGAKHKKEDSLFELRLATNLGIIQHLFFSLYPEEKYGSSFKKLLSLLPKLFASRPDDLRQQDLSRIKSGNWYQSEKWVGMQLYVEHFNKDLKGLQEKIPYFKNLGINFLHLMPITKRPNGENDGGYAVNSYHEVDKKYGTKKDLENLTNALRKEGIILMLDFVVNHTSDEFPWAKKAKQGNKKYQRYYYTYENRTIPNEFEKSLPEVFPETSPGNYTFIPEMDQWVMTVFNDYQWDLNYTNPEVFMEMLANLVKLANLGVDMVRFDALAFLWKKMGTISQNLPEAHRVVSLFRMCLQVIAPGTIFLAEAIVAPKEIVKYFGEGVRRGNECEVAYNASLMALLWNSIATKKTILLYKSLVSVPSKPKDGTWLNYVRCHDDIGLGYDDGFIWEIGWNPQQHRKFLLDYYCQRLDWSPSKGLMFMYNPKTGDGRITGSTASLLGLEKGIKKNDAELTNEAIDKIILLHAIIFSFAGIPIVYAGDEIGALNDYSFLEDEAKKEDSRWVNRPQQDWDVIKGLKNTESPQSKIFHVLKKLISIRKASSIFADSDNTVLHHTGNDHILVFERTGGTQNGLLVVCNFDEKPQVIEATWIMKLGYFTKGEPKDLISDQKITVQSGLLEVHPYQVLWLAKN